jgi:hypothetical protein
MAAVISGMAAAFMNHTENVIRHCVKLFMFMKELGKTPHRLWGGPNSGPNEPGKSVSKRENLLECHSINYAIYLQLYCVLLVCVAKCFVGVITQIGLEGRGHNGPPLSRLAPGPRFACHCHRSARAAHGESGSHDIVSWVCPHPIQFLTIPQAPSRLVTKVLSIKQLFR